ncbi:MAG: hypothetical protein JXA21_14710 [Anaerolineae bacterium]|nr:hypothetical protein [Anaerolineae bacterium]
MIAKLREKGNLRLWLILGTIAVPVLITLAVILRGMAYQVIVVPVLWLLFVANFLLDAVPQTFFWILLWFFLLRIAVRSLLRTKRLVHKPQPGEREPATGRVSVWEQRLSLARRGDYSRWGIARHMLTLLLDIVVSRESALPLAVRDRVRAGTYPAPPEIAAYFQAAMQPQISYAPSFFKRLAHRFAWRKSAPESPALNLDLERVVEFLEDQLEVPQ